MESEVAKEETGRKLNWRQKGAFTEPSVKSESASF